MASKLLFWEPNLLYLEVVAENFALHLSLYLFLDASKAVVARQEGVGADERASESGG